MKIDRQGGTLRISDIQELGLANCDSFRDEVSQALPDDVRDIVVDLSETIHMDCSGLGALMALQKAARRGDGGVSVSFLNLTPPVRRLFDLTNVQPGLDQGET